MRKTTNSHFSFINTSFSPFPQPFLTLHTSSQRPKSQRMSVNITISLSPDDFRAIRQYPRYSITLPTGTVRAVVDAVKAMDSKLNGDDTKKVRLPDKNDDDYDDGMRVTKKRRRSSRDDGEEDPARKAARRYMWQKRQPILAYRQRPNSFQIFVKSLTGTTDTYIAGPSTTIGEVMGMIAWKTGLPPENQKIVFAGKRLTPPPEDDHWEELALRTLGSVSVFRTWVRCSG